METEREAHALLFLFFSLSMSDSPSTPSLPEELLTKLFHHLRGIGTQVNQLVVRFDWDRSMIPHLKRITGHLEKLRALLWECAAPQDV